MSLKVLYAASEVFPFAKTGGLADVAAGLPKALAARGAELRVALPAYRGWEKLASDARVIAQITVRGQTFAVWQAIAAPNLAYWFLDCPALFDRPGDPYQEAAGHPWQDNSRRFGSFAEALARLSVGCGDFLPDIVHANDWHTGLVMPWLRAGGAQAAGVFTIHNLAYQGIFAAEQASELQLPESWWHMEGVEFHGQLNHMKAGIVYADAVTTVSPNYAQEIQTTEYGQGLEGLLRAHRGKLHGIVNGIEEQSWNPASDPAIARRYDSRTVKSGKRANKSALQQEMGLNDDPAPALLGVVSRLAHQKGIDLIVQVHEALRHLPVQFAILGEGEPQLRHDLRHIADANPGRFALRLGHDEACARRIIAGADLFLMPSRFEPCGLTQMYSQRYGTVPLVRKTGGLADTVVDARDAALADGTATGIQFIHADTGGLIYGIRRALELRSAPARWLAMQRTGMKQDFSWDKAAGEYLALYRSLSRHSG